jgi:hypothetical protein
VEPHRVNVYCLAGVILRKLGDDCLTLVHHEDEFRPSEEQQQDSDEDGQEKTNRGPNVLLVVDGEGGHGYFEKVEVLDERGSTHICFKYYFIILLFK